MAKNDQQEAFEKTLTSQLARLLDLNKFAEAKNATLIAFSSASGVSQINSLTQHTFKVGDVVNYSLISISCFTLSVVIAFYSFLPKISIAGLTFASQPKPNLLFFGDVADMSLLTFRSQLISRYLPSESNSTTEEYLEDLSTQLYVVSKIATSKFKLFNIASA